MSTEQPVEWGEVQGAKHFCYKRKSDDHNEDRHDARYLGSLHEVNKNIIKCVCVTFMSESRAGVNVAFPQREEVDFIWEFSPISCFVK